MPEPTKTWADLQVLARTDPIVHELVYLVERGHCTKEDGLIAAVVALSEVRDRLYAYALNILENAPPVPHG